MTACNACYQKYSIENAQKFSWKCINCKGAIKKGVKDRIMELATLPENRHPAFRPKYTHFIPLAEIIQAALGLENPNGVKAQAIWRELVERFGTEIKVLVDTPIEEIKEANPVVGKKMESFRKGYVTYIPGGGGEYGKPLICDSEKEFNAKKEEVEKTLTTELSMHGQKRLGDF